MNIIPWRRSESLTPRTFDFDDMWSRFFGNGEEGLTTRIPDFFKSIPLPAVNIAETEDEFSITMDCPGLDEDDFEIQTMGKQLIISGERKWEEEKKGKEFRRVESRYGKFERTVQLPENALMEPEKIDACYKKGILTLTVPKLEKTPTTKIPVHH
jgi:HSP20 family protein